MPLLPTVDEVKARVKEKREKVKTRIEEIKGKIEERRAGASSTSSNSPQLKIRAEIKEKGVIPAIRDRIEARRARRLGEAASPEVEVEEEEGLKFQRGAIAIEG